MNQINLLNCSQKKLQTWLSTIGQPSYRADQIIQWVYQRGVTNFDEMTNLSQSLRDYLSKHAVIEYPKIIQSQTSIDGTRKWLFQLSDGQMIESVYIPEKSRGTLCISSQVGCPLQCKFCATGKQGFIRNLNLFEIMGQVYVLIKKLCSNFKTHEHVTNVVFMGMGEPLLNLTTVIDAVDLLMSDFAYGFSKYRITVSTIGLIEPLKQLKKMSPASLAISLHAPTDKLRNQLMPATSGYTLKTLINFCKEYFPKKSKRKITFEYILIRGINDQIEHAKELIQLLSPISCKVNLIVFNPIPKSTFQPSLENTVAQFQQLLIKTGINTRLRKSRGPDIDAACGQLVGEKRKDI